MSSEPIRLQAGETIAVVDPARGGRLVSLVVDGRELLVQHGSDIFHWGSFPIAPWVGRLRHGRLHLAGRDFQLPVNAAPHALHGLVTDRVWTVTGPGELTVDLAEPWPWPCQVVQSVSLSEKRIDFRLEVHAQQPMPAAIGWHPWFNRELVDPAGRRSALVELVVRPGKMYLNDAEGLPSGELGPPVAPPWDYCFVEMAQPPVVRWPDLLELTVRSDCDHWVLYDMEKAGACVEPWTGPPNSLNMASPTIVTAEHPLHAAMSWTWQELTPA